MSRFLIDYYIISDNMFDYLIFLKIGYGITEFIGEY